MKNSNHKARTGPVRATAGRKRERPRAARKKPTVAILHYSCPPVIGGVEFVIESHARLFANEGIAVRTIVGKGGDVHQGVSTRVVPEIASDGGPLRAVVGALNKGAVPNAFPQAVKQVERELKKALKGVDVCMVHNVMTMHFNLVATAALANIMADGGKTRFIAWCHDSTFADASYRRHQREEYPWSLLKQALPGCRYSVISKQRQKEFSRLFGIPRTHLPVFPDGVSVTSLLGLTPQVRAFYREEKIFDKDIVAITPTRIVRRKNLETGIEIVAAMKAMGKSVRWMITGAPDPHNADANVYYRELVMQRKKLGIEKEVVFLCERFKERIGRESLRSLMAISDMLMFPSKKEGFGIPVLEAGLADLILVLSDIPALREIAGPDAVYIPRDYNPRAIAKLAWSAFRKSPNLQFRKRILRDYSWPAVFVKKILPAILDPDSVWPKTELRSAEI